MSAALVRIAVAAVAAVALQFVMLIAMVCLADRIVGMVNFNAAITAKFLDEFQKAVREAGVSKNSTDA